MVGVQRPTGELLMWAGLLFGVVSSKVVVVVVVANTRNNDDDDDDKQQTQQTNTTNNKRFGIGGRRFFYCCYEFVKNRILVSLLPQPSKKPFTVRSLWLG